MKCIYFETRLTKSTDYKQVIPDLDQKPLQKSQKE